MAFPFMRGNKTRVFGFLRMKLAGASFGSVLFTQIESLVFGLFRGIPGIPGFFVRYLLGKVFFGKLDGWCWIQSGVTIVHSDRLRVGKHFACNTGTYIGAAGGITIGDYVLLGTNVTITSGVHPTHGRTPPIWQRPVEYKPVVIEDDVWLGAGVVILPGVTVRRGTVVGANSVVTKNTEEYAIYVGAPARKIGSRDDGSSGPGLSAP